MTDYGEYVRARISQAHHTDTAEGYPCELINSLGRHLSDYKLSGNSSQSSAPTISEPVDIVSVGDLVTDETDENYGKYKIPVVAYGKNFLDCTHTADTYSYGITVNKDFSITVNAGSNNLSVPINIKQSKTYTMPADNITLVASCKNISDEIKMVIKVRKVNTAAFDYYTLTSGSQTLTFSNGDTIQVYLQIPANGVVSKTVTLYPQLELGDTATDFEPYIKPVITNVYLDEPLRKIGDYSDYIDFKRQVAVRNIKEFTIPSTMSWNSWQGANGTRLMLYQTSDKLYGSSLTTLGYFNRGIVSQKMVSSNKSNILCANDSVYNCYWYPDYTQMGLDGSEDIATANTALQAWLKSAGETYFTYVLAKSVEEKVSLPIVPVPKGNVFVATNTTLPASNIHSKYAIKP